MKAVRRKAIEDRGAAAVGQSAPGSDRNVPIPSRLADRVEDYASRNATEPFHVVIEAIDAFLRDRSAEGGP